MNYNYEPGDSPYFIPPGNGNGVHDSNGGGNGDNSCNLSDPTYSSEESSQVWAHLTQSKMLSGGYVGFQPSDCGGSHATSSAPDQMAGVVFPIFSKSTLGVNSPLYYIHLSSNPRYYYTNGHAIPTLDAVALDTKLDDGTGLTGNMIMRDLDDNGCETNIGNNDLDYQNCSMQWLPDGPGT